MPKKCGITLIIRWALPCIPDFILRCKCILSPATNPVMALWGPFNCRDVRMAYSVPRAHGQALLGPLVCIISTQGARPHQCYSRSLHPWQRSNLFFEKWREGEACGLARPVLDWPSMARLRDMPQGHAGLALSRPRPGPAWPMKLHSPAWLGLKPAWPSFLL